MFDSFFKVKIFFKKNLPWLFVILGLLIIIIYLNIEPKEENKSFLTALMSVATALISGGVFASVLKSLQFSNIFGEEIEKIIYSQKFLAGQKGIEKIWHRVTKALYVDHDLKRGIGQACHEIILDKYLAHSEEYYYENVDQHFDIKWVDPKNKDEVIIHFTQEMDIIASTINDIVLAPSNTQQVDAVKENSYVAEFFEVTGKGRTRKETKLEPLEVRNALCTSTKFVNETVIKHEFRLSGKKKYKVRRKISHKQSLLKDRIYKFTTQKHTNKLSLKVASPVDLNVNFLSVGTLDTFDPTPSHQSSNISVEYKDILFPQQGYVLVLG